MGKYALMFDKSNPQSVSMTERSHKGETDINKIVARAEKNKVFPVSTRPAIFADFSGYDFERNMITIAKANEAFMSLPVDIRKRFNNNVSELVAFVEDPKNKDEAIKLGLVVDLTKKPVYVDKKQPEAQPEAGQAPAGA